jgi:hypothetical protein
MLAIWVAWSMQWPEVAKLLLDEIHISDVCVHFANICKHLQEDGIWKLNTSDLDGANQHEEKQKILISGLDQFMADLKERRVEEKDFPAHWYHLPWEVWINDKDFRYCLKHMEDFWQHLEQGKDIELQYTLDLIKLMTL